MHKATKKTRAVPQSVVAMAFRRAYRVTMHEFRKFMPATAHMMNVQVSELRPRNVTMSMKGRRVTKWRKQAAAPIWENTAG